MMLHFDFIATQKGLWRGALRAAASSGVLLALLLLAGFCPSPPAGPKPPPVTKPAPAFTLADAQGHSRSLADFRGHPVALFFFCGCQWCHECADAWAQLQRGNALPAPASGARPPAKNDPRTVVVFQGDAEAVRAFATETGLDTAQTLLLPDPKLAVTLRYQALPCPRVFVLDGQGIVRYTNDHADDAPQKAPALAIVSRAVSALRACAAPIPPAAPRQPKRKAHGHR
ncbi:MAG TPA: redoxin domain-containing protein [Chthonomonadaceae bacterium]|nr:redoxin domain-containing protein [Chthonomonadaceae bacterium]